MKSSVVEKIAEWLEENGIHESINGKIDKDGYTIYSENEIAGNFTKFINSCTGIRYNFIVNADDKSNCAYGTGVKLFELYYNDLSDCGWDRNGQTALYFRDLPLKDSLEQLGQWFAKNTQFTPFPKFKMSDFEDN